MNPLLVIADDATGALEAGALLAGRGFQVSVEFEIPGGAQNAARVLLLPVRHEAPEAAGRLVSEMLATLCGAALPEIAPRVYWKTDSTLRGPIGACFDALLGAFPETPLVYVPAYPAMGRTVLRGELQVHGIPFSRTPFAAVGAATSSSRVVERIAEGLRYPIEAVESAAQLRLRLAGLSFTGRSVVFVCDASTEAEVSALMEACSRTHPAPLVAGPAGGVAAWAGECGTAPSCRSALQAVTDWLVVCGSRHALSRSLLSEAAERGLRVIAMPQEEASDPEAALATLARRAAGEVREGIVIFGGDTVLAVSRALSLGRFRPLGELLPGVAASMAGRFTVVTRAGGFATPGLFDVLLAGKAE